MITKFDTSSVEGATSKGGGGKIMLLVAVLIGGFLVYKFILKPKMDKKNQEEQ